MEMKELQELLAKLKDAGAPEKVVKELEMLIEKRALRIMRQEKEIRRWISDKEKELIEKDKNFDFLLLLFLILILDSDRVTDDFRVIDLMPFIQDRREKDSLAEPNWSDVKPSKPKTN
jgi:hypothetical protein